MLLLTEPLEQGYESRVLTQIVEIRVDTQGDAWGGSIVRPPVQPEKRLGMVVHPGVDESLFSERAHAAL
jgi:hypothetical protein